MRRSVWLVIPAVLGGIYLVLGASPSSGKQKEGAPGDSFFISIDPVALKQGEEAAAVISFRAGSRFKWNLEYPARVELKGEPKTVSVPRTSFRSSSGDFEVSEKEASVKIPLTGRAPGQEKLAAEAKFSVCNDNTCLIETARVEIPVTVQQ